MTSSDVARTKRPGAVLADMVRSLGLLAVIVAVTLVFVPGLLHPSKSQRVQPVSFADEARGFHQVTGVAALTPSGLPTGWYVNSASLTHGDATAHLHVGFVSPANRYAALEESNSALRGFVSDTLGPRGLKRTGTVTLGGRTWNVCVSGRGERSLTVTAGKVTVVITGSMTAPEQDRLASSLNSP